MTFDGWWDSLGAHERPFGAAYKIIAAKAWNAGVEQACLIFGMNEGVDFGAEDALHVGRVEGHEL